MTKKRLVYTKKTKKLRPEGPDAWLSSPIYLGILLPAYTEITQISDLRFILSEDHPKNDVVSVKIYIYTFFMPTSIHMYIYRYGGELGATIATQISNYYIFIYIT